MNNPQPFKWAQIDHGLVEERTTAIRKELSALLAKGPTFKEEDRLAELADQLYNVYGEVWELQGFRKSAMFIRTVYGMIALQIRAKISSVNSGLRSADSRRGGLTSSRGKQIGLDLTGTRVASTLVRRAEARVREWGYTERATTSRPSSKRVQSSDGQGTIEKKNFDRGIQPKIEGELASASENLELVGSAERPGQSAKGSEILRFVRRGNNLVAQHPSNMEAAIAETYKLFLPDMMNARSIVRSRGGNITVAELQRHFKNTDFAKASDAEDWQTFIDEFSRKRSAGPKNLTVALLARRCGLSNETVATYTKPSRKRKKAVRK